MMQGREPARRSEFGKGFSDVTNPRRATFIEIPLDAPSRIRPALIFRC
jgi:hypothetical protein